MGHAKDFVKAMSLILQQDGPDDYVIATGKQYSVRQLIEFGAAELDMHFEWRGNGIDGIGMGRKTVTVDPRYFRPTEVDTLLGDPTKSKKKLGWEAKISLDQLVREMVANDLEDAKRDALVREAGYKTFDRHE